MTLIITELENRKELQPELSVLKSVLKKGTAVKFVCQGTDIRVFYKEYCLGTLPKKCHSGYSYAVISRLEPLVTTMNVELACISDDEYERLQQAARFEYEWRQRMEREALLRSERIEQERKKREDAHKEIEAVISRGMFFHWWVANRYEAEYTKYQSSVMADDDTFEMFFEREANYFLNIRPGNEEILALKSINAEGYLKSFVDKYMKSIYDKRNQFTLNEQSAQTSSRTYGQTDTGRRVTHCWQCKKTISTDIYGTCQSCKWIRCACGACMPHCAKQVI